MRWPGRRPIIRRLAIGPITTRRSAALLLGLSLTAAPAAARDAGSGTFDLYLRGLSAATLTFGAEETAGRYATTASLRSAGLVSLFQSIAFDVTAEGAIQGNRAAPARYTETAELGSRQTAAEVVWQNGVPQVLRNDPKRPPRARDLKPESQAGTIDPLTAIFAGLRDQPRDGICATDALLFDGRRRSRVTLASPQAAGDGITCSGRYQRIAGFSDREMAQKTEFRFTVTYAPGPGGLMRATEVATDTVFGQARLIRRQD